MGQRDTLYTLTTAALVKEAGGLREAWDALSSATQRASGRFADLDAFVDQAAATGLDPGKASWDDILHAAHSHWHSPALGLVGLLGYGAGRIRDPIRRLLADKAQKVPQAKPFLSRLMGR